LALAKDGTVSVALPAFSVLSLFSGCAGLDLGIGLAVPGARTVCYVERESYAVAVLAARMEEGRLHPAPIWSDVTTFDGQRWRGVVDCVAGGFPCQDISNAGKRVGIDGERSGLWSEFARIIREVGPEYVFVENVAALLVRGFERVLGDLAEMGFDAEWGVFRAADAGAPHLRERVFVLAHAGRFRLDGIQPVGIGGASIRPALGAKVKTWPTPTARDHKGEDALRREGGELAGKSEDMANTDETGRQRLGRDVPEDADASTGRDADGRGSAPQGGHEFPPGPDDADGWADYLERWPGTEPAVRRGADGIPHRVDRLRLLGNAVVPQQAAIAWRELARRFGG
jgi:DNA (cytosine-5)-methyltransferase 1